MLQRVSGFLHKDDEEAPQTSVHMKRYFVFDSQLVPKSIENISYSPTTKTLQDTGGMVGYRPKALGTVFHVLKIWLFLTFLIKLVFQM